MRLGELGRGGNAGERAGRFPTSCVRRGSDAHSGYNRETRFLPPASRSPARRHSDAPRPSAPDRIRSHDRRRNENPAAARRTGTTAPGRRPDVANPRDTRALAPGRIRRTPGRSRVAFRRRRGRPSIVASHVLNCHVGMKESAAASGLVVRPDALHCSNRCRAAPSAKPTCHRVRRAEPRQSQVLRRVARHRCSRSRHPCGPAPVNPRRTCKCPPRSRNR